MKNKIFLFLFLAITVIAGCTKERPENNTLVIYTYDSMGWITEKMIPLFEQDKGCTVEVVKLESTSKIITRLMLEKKKPKADLAIGLTPTMLNKAVEEKLVTQYKSKNIGRISDPSLFLDEKNYATPYDYGALAIVYNPEKMQTPPASFDELLSLKDAIIIQDPRSSSTGTDFLLWTIAMYGDKWPEFWKGFSSTVLTASAGWSESFAKFENGEAPMMVSYATDAAYSIHNYGSSAYKLFIPEGKGYIQREGVSLVQGSPNEDLAKDFIDFMLSDAFQKEVPLNQWMFPVTDVELPEVFDNAVTPESIVSLDTNLVNTNLEKWLEQWEAIMATKGE